MNKGFTTAEISSKPTEQKNRAFTLAEVLITLGIIGIVAAMTLPTVINNAQDRQFRAMLKKQYSVIAQAIQLIFAKDNILITPQEDGWLKMPYFVCRIGEQLKSIRSGLKCDEVLINDDYVMNDQSSLPKNANVHWHRNGEWYDKTGKALNMNGGGTEGYGQLTFVLPDGAWVNFNCTNTVFIDVNGVQRPNTVGRDIFYFLIKDNQFSPVFWTSDTGNNINGCSGSENYTLINKDNYKEDCKSGSGWGCSPMYILD